MATTVTITASYRDDDYFNEKNAPVYIYSGSRSSGTVAAPGDFVKLTGTQTVAGAKTWTSLATFSAGMNITGAVTATGEVESWDTSDIDLKEDIQDLQKRKTLAALMRLRPVRYWHKLKKKREIGLIAQEVIKDFPEVVKKDENGYLMISYGKLIPALLAAIQSMKEEIDILKDMLNDTRGE